MKKRLILALCLVLVVMLTAVPAIAAGSVDAWLSADTTSVSPGSTVNITVSAEVDNCGAGGIYISFDNAVFELTGGSCLLSGATYQDFATSNRDGVFTYDDAISISGDVFQFSMKVKDSAPAGSHTVNVTFTADGISVSDSVTLSIACDHSYDDGCDESCNKCGATRDVEHNFDEGKVTTTASCDKEGVKTYTCATCGKTETETIEKTEHNFDEGKVTTPASCDKEGVKTYTCATCGKTETEAVAIIDHTWDSGKVTKEATCEENGEITYTCTACQTTKTEETDTLEHNFTVIGYVPATCEENGEMEFLCADCGYTYDDYIEAKGHSFDYDCDEECSACGFTRETEHDFGDTWFSDKTSHYQQCNICGLAQEPVPHIPGPEANETEDQVCLTCGFVLEAAGRHTHKAAGNFLSNENTHWYLCQCGELMGENAHHWEDKGIENGVQTYKCVICSRVETKPVETTAPTEATTVPSETTQPTTETTTPIVNPVDHVGIPGLVIIIPLAIVGLAVLGSVCYVVIGLILGYRKKGKFDAKRKTAPVEEPMAADEGAEAEDESKETEEAEEAAADAENE